MSFTIAVRHTFTTLLLSPSLTPPGAASVHPLPGPLSQSGRGRSLEDAISISGPTVWNSLPSELRLIDWSMYISPTAEVPYVSTCF